MVGHYGKPALIAGGLSVVLLVMHLAVPFAVLEWNDDFGFDDETMSRGDVATNLEDGDHYGLAMPGVTLAGIIMALVAGALLVGLGLAPLPVTVARLLGWTAGAVGATGAFMAFTSSLFPLGAGFTTLLGVIFGNEMGVTRLWVVSPVIVAVGSVFMGFFFFKVLTTVIATGSGLRTEATTMLRAPFFAALLLFAALVMPWTILPLDGDEIPGCAGGGDGCDGRIDFYSAWGQSDNAQFGGILAAAEQSQDTPFEAWQHLAFTLKIIIAGAWVAFFVALVGTVGHVVASIVDWNWAPRVSAGLQLANAIMLPWVAVQLLLGFIYQWKPTYDEANPLQGMDWLFGFFPLVAVAPLGFLIFHQIRANLGIVLSGRNLVTKVNTTGHTFD